MLCYIYRSSKKANTYLYMSEKDDFDCLPENMLQVFGIPEFFMSIDLTPERKLVQADCIEVLGNLESKGYFLQLPKTGYSLQHIEERIVASLQRQERE